MEKGIEEKKWIFAESSQIPSSDVTFDRKLDGRKLMFTAP